MSRRSTLRGDDAATYRDGEQEKMSINFRARASYVPALLAAVVTLSGAPPVLADEPLPPSHFYYDVIQGHMSLPDCTPRHGSSSGGTCGSESSGPGFAATSGGIGTPSYLPVTPGGTVLGTGTAVDSLSTFDSGWGWTKSVASMIYSFQATGPASVDYIPVDVLSTGLTSVAGDGRAYLSLTIWGPAGASGASGPLLDLTAFCSHGVCSGSWGSGEQVTDALCVLNGDNYVVKITALTSAHGRSQGSVNSASAVLDPLIKLDPPYPKSCPVDVPISELSLRTGPGSSTGYRSAPEPSPLSLAVAAAAGLLLFGRRRVLLRAVRSGR
jgi:hypothetical protein